MRPPCRFVQFEQIGVAPSTQIGVTTMTTTTSTTPQDRPIPAGVAKTDEWQDDTPLPYRVLLGELRNIDGGSDYTTVQATAVQFADWRIDGGSVHEAAARLSRRRRPHRRPGPRAGRRSARTQPTRLIGGRSDEQLRHQVAHNHQKASARHPACVAGRCVICGVVRLTSRRPPSTCTPIASGVAPGRGWSSAPL